MRNLPVNFESPPTAAVFLIPQSKGLETRLLSYLSQIISINTVWIHSDPL